LQTRLRKLDDPTSNYTALILASAGLIRVDLASRITASVASPLLYHAVGQGAIGIEIREGDARAAQLVGALEDWKTGWTTRCERSMLRVLEGGCSVPVGCETKLVDDHSPAPLPSNSRNHYQYASTRTPTTPYDKHSCSLTLTGTVTSLAGTSFVLATKTRLVQSIEDAELLGSDIARELIGNGARRILEELGKHVKEVGGEEGKEVPFESNYGVLPPDDAFPVIAASGKVERTVFTDALSCQRPQGW
jgi:hydroxymethylbilane synthase